MVKRLYLDGCSMVYGPGLAEQQRLASLFRNQGKYEVTDNSRLGKSNLAIAMDTYKNLNNFDIIVLGFSYASRFYMQYQGQDLDFYSGFHGQGLDLKPTNTAAEIEKEFLQVYKYFYSTFESPFSDNLSDLLIDGIIGVCKSQNKKIIAFSWEPRNTLHKIQYPYLGPGHRLDDGHLSAAGTEFLYNFLQNLNNE